LLSYDIIIDIDFQQIVYLSKLAAAADFDAPLDGFPALPDFSEQQWVWNGVHSALVRVNEELLERKVAAPV
jgi:hypothetical protein